MDKINSQVPGEHHQVGAPHGAGGQRPVLLLLPGRQAPAHRPRHAQPHHLQVDNSLRRTTSDVSINSRGCQLTHLLATAQK